MQRKIDEIPEKERSPSGFAPNRGRAFLKMLVVVCGLLTLAGLLSLTLDHKAIDGLKFNLSIMSLITVIVIINLISFACFMMLYAAYHWVSRDLKCPRAEDQSDLAD